MTRPPRPYKPIADYAVIGDQHSCALVARDGSIDWACFPRFDSPSVFGRLLDAEKGGYFQIAPERLEEFESRREYVGRTNVLRTEFFDHNGNNLELLDFMPIFDTRQHRISNRIARIVRCIRGRVAVRIQLCARFNYGRTHVTHSHAHQGGREILLGHPSESISLKSTVPLEFRAPDEMSATAELAEGEHLSLLMTYFPHLGEDAAPMELAHLDELLRTTQSYWEGWSSQTRYQGPYEPYVFRSALTLGLLTYEPTGAIIAAPTASLPETLGGIRNWDYRYAWLRDSTLTVHSLHLVGHPEAARRFQDWQCNWAGTCCGEIQVMYDVCGGTHLEEEELSHWEGYLRSAPVRIGNAASTQRQLDVYGEVIFCLWSCLNHGDDRVTPRWEGIKALVQFVCEHWREPDSGIWEMRSTPKHFVHSKVMAWVGLDRAIRASELLGLEADTRLWRAEADEIRKEVLERGWSERKQSFVQDYDSEALDAANLRISLVGFLPASHPKMVATVDAVLRELMNDGLIYRYKNADDGLFGDEGAFVICSFWMAENLIALGRKDEARVLIERVLSYANDVHLLAEQIDPKTGMQLGNFPQGFSHIGLLVALSALQQD